MNVLHVITDLKTGGAEKLMVDLLPKLKDNSANVELCVFNGEETPYSVILRQAGITIHCFGNKPKYYDFRHIFRLIKLASRYDIIHTHNTAPQLFGAIASMFVGKNWITTEHTTTSHRRVWWYKPIERWLYNRYDRIICISEAAKTAVLSITHNSSPKISIVANGVDLVRFKSAPQIDRSSIGRSTQNKIVLLMVGRYSYQKDQATIIRAMSLLPEHIELWLAGYGETEYALNQLIKDHKLEERVFLLGMRTDVPQLLKSSDIVVQSSHIEGFGMAAVEAMAAGKPVVASDVPGLRDVVTGAGILFEHGNHHQLTTCINRLLSNPELYETMIKKGFNRAQIYSIDQMTSNYIKSYNQLYDN